MEKASRTLKIVIAAIAFYAMSWFAVEAEGGNSETDSLIVNGGFEQEVAGVPVGWSQDAWKTDGSTVFRLERTESGVVAVVENIQPNDARWSQKVEVEPDTIYRLSGRVRAENVGMSATGANLTVLGILETSRDLKGTTGWEEVHLIGRTGKNQHEITVTARLGGYGNLNTGKAFFDDIRLEKLNAVPDGERVVSFEPVQAGGEGGGNGGSGKNVAAGPKWLSTGVLMFWSLLFAGLLAFTYRVFVTGSPESEERFVARFVWAALAAAAVIRFTVAPSVVGFPTDVNTFKAWAERAAAGGLRGFYEGAAFLGGSVFVDYPPGYVYVLYVIGKLREWFGLAHDSGAYLLLVKMPSLLADLAVGVWLVRVARRTGRPILGAALAVVYWFNPAVLINGAVWGQIDSFFTLALLISFDWLARDRFVRSCVSYGIALLIKPQALLFGPLFLFKAAEKRDWKMLSKGAVAGAATVFVLSLPFMPGTDPFWFIHLYAGTLNQYPHASLNAYNLYALFGANWKPLETSVLGVPLSLWGYAALASAVVFAGWLWFRGKLESAAKTFGVGAVLLAGIFLVSIKMHERYLFPFIPLALAAFAFIRDRRLFALVGAFSIVHFLNVGYVLAGTLGPNGGPPADSGFVRWVSLAHLALFAWLVKTAVDVMVRGRLVSPVSSVAYAREQEKAQHEFAGSDQRAYATAVAQEAPPVRLTRIDWLLMGGLTAVYAVVALIRLGSLSAPETFWKPSFPGQSVVLDFGQTHRLEKMYSYAGAGTSKYRVEFSENGQQWTNPTDIVNDYVKNFVWQSFQLSGVQARYARVVAVETGSGLHELAFFEAGGKRPIPVVAVRGESGVSQADASRLTDESDAVPERPSFMNGTYFDEIYHARTAYEHLHRLEPYETTHPPLGKVFIMIGIWLFGMNAFGWRIVGTLFGIAMVPLMYLFGKRLFRRTDLAFVSAFLFTFDFMHFAQTRIATIDVYGVFFIIAMFYFMHRYMELSFYRSPLVRTFVPLGLCGFSFGLGIASKWIVFYGGAGLAFLFFLTLWRRWKEYDFARRRLTVARGDDRRLFEHVVRTFPRATAATLAFACLMFVVVPSAIYVASYIPTFLVPGPGHDLKDFWTYQKNMYNYHSHLEATHPFGSPWWQWPFMYKPIWYYAGQGLPEGMVSSIVSFGNPLVWWPGVFALAFVVWRMWSRRETAMLVPVTAYVTQYVPWMLVPRLTFIYHYFAMVPFLAFFLAESIRILTDRKPGLWKAVYAYLAGVLLLFAMFYPILSGMTVPRAYVAYFLRWFDSWYFY